MELSSALLIDAHELGDVGNRDPIALVVPRCDEGNPVKGDLEYNEVLGRGDDLGLFGYCVSEDPVRFDRRFGTGRGRNDLGLSSASCLAEGAVEDELCFCALVLISKGVHDDRQARRRNGDKAPGGLSWPIISCSSASSSRV